MSMKKIAQYCEERNIIYMCTPWDIESLNILSKLNIAAFKIASADLTNMPLIECSNGFRQAFNIVNWYEIQKLKFKIQ